MKSDEGCLFETMKMMRGAGVMGEREETGQAGDAAPFMLFGGAGGLLSRDMAVTCQPLNEKPGCRAIRSCREYELTPPA